MTYHFKLELTRLQMLGGQLNEIGKLEMRLFGLGITRHGTLVLPGFRKLGSYHGGDDRSTGVFPMTLFEADLPDDGLDVALMLWPIEEDSGEFGDNVSKLEEKFEKAYRKQAQTLSAFGFPRGCIPLAAYYRALIPFAGQVKTFATHWWKNDDDVGDPMELFFTRRNQNLLGESGQVLVTLTGAGTCTLTLGYSYEKVGGPGLDL